MEPLVYIIIVNYNCFRETAECVESISEIDYSNYKLLVVDNASTETPSSGLLEYISKNSIYIENEVNSGFSEGNNIAIRLALREHADFVLLINGDTVVEKNFLDCLVAAAEDNQDAGIVCGKIMYYDNPEIQWYAGGEINLKNGNVVQLGWGEKDALKISVTKTVTFATGCLMLIPTRLLRDVGLLDNRYFLYCEDTDFCCRVMNAGYRIIYCSDAVIYHKISRSVGKLSLAKQYYMVRNALYIVRFYGEKKWYGYVHMTLQNIKNMIKNELKLKVILMAYLDFINGRMGAVKI